MTIELFSELNNLLKQFNTWIWISPIFFLCIIAGLFGVSFHTSRVELLGSWTVVIVSFLFWWMWIVRVFSEIVKVFNLMYGLVQEIKEEVIHIKEEVHEA